MKAVVCEVFRKFHFFVGKGWEKVNPGYTLTTCHLFKHYVAMEYNHFFANHVFITFEVVVDRQPTLKIYFSGWCLLFDFYNKFFHRSSDAVGSEVVRYIIHTNEKENLFRFTFSNEFKTVRDSLHHIADDSAVFDVCIIKCFIPTAVVAKAVAKNDNIVAINRQFGKV